ncbi:dual specificity mitogen-activated protein kinase kinase 6-like protein [Leptotrombidium deliense]|uniref:mitogen-activated protein kinase kinase n=1 Tax=Leptotrombidium deliense TaxID=299467 RepID=A0A443SGY6_9ACAR|nr:dual specificity mitogen-activated protein kinase kinase 6-like protein [Leptotrombidium deliense]
MAGKIRRLPKFKLETAIIESKPQIVDLLDSKAVITVQQKTIEVNNDNIDVIEELGRGAFGVVEKVRHKSTGLEMAVKRIAITEQQQRLMDMNVLMTGRGCDNIVHFYGALYCEGDLWLFMEILDISMEKFYDLYNSYTRINCSNAAAVFPEIMLGKVASSVLNALHYLHKRCIIHRDIKPSNILVNRCGAVKLCDFGISGYLVNSIAKSFEAGCKPYMAPERLNPKDSNGYDSRSDVWSLGITLIEVAIGKYPYKFTSKQDFFILLKTICIEPSPKLPASILKKDYKQRPKFDKLLEHEFILKNKDADISPIVRRILNFNQIEISRRPPRLQPLEPSENPAPITPTNLDRRTNITFDGQSIEVDPEDIEILAPLGRGAYGIVEKVKHRPSGIEMAVKRITAISQQEQRRFLMDMDVLMTGRACQNIVKFYGALFWEGDLWLFMEIMDTSLDKFYKMVYDNKNENEDKKTIPEEVLGKIVAGVVNALHYLHSIQIIHRDIKPSNILINRKGEVKLCDFGISGRLVNSIAQTYDAGCKPYMAPERINPDPNRQGYDIRSDVWSLGITTMELATGVFPYQTSGGFFEQLKRVCKDTPPRLPPGKYSPELEDFIVQCLQKDYEKRPNYRTLTEHEFLQKHKDNDISEFVSAVLDAQNK